jgi:DNA repair exonuclease SbcCD ATPase subunit
METFEDRIDTLNGVISQLNRQFETLQLQSQNKSQLLDQYFKYLKTNVQPNEDKLSVLANSIRTCDATYKATEGKISRLETEKLSIIEKIKYRAQLRGIEPILTNEKIRSIEKHIDDLRNELRSLCDQRTNLVAKQKELDISRIDKRSLERELEVIINEIKENRNKYETVERERSELKRIILEDKWLERYKEYAAKHFIFYDEDDDQDIFRQCNEFHQEHLLTDSNDGDGWFVKEGCPHRYTDDECEGWYYNNKRCECGNYKGWTWNHDDFDPTDLSQFNIEHEVPYGNAEPGW